MIELVYLIFLKKESGTKSGLTVIDTYQSQLKRKYLLLQNSAPQWTIYHKHVIPKFWILVWISVVIEIRLKSLGSIGIEDKSINQLYSFQLKLIKISGLKEKSWIFSVWLKSFILKLQRKPPIPLRIFPTHASLLAWYSVCGKNKWKNRRKTC